MEKFILNFIRVTGFFTTIATLILLLCLVTGLWEWATIHPVRAFAIVIFLILYIMSYLFIELTQVDED